MTDRRTRDYREAEVLDVIRLTGGASPIWLRAHPGRFPALRRLADAELIASCGDPSPEFMRFEILPDEPPTWIERFWAKVRGGISW